MTQEPITETVPTTAISIFKKDDVAKKFQELLGKRSSSFITSVMSIVASNELLKNAEPNSVYLSALVSATLDLPINPNLWFAYILPYKNKDGVQISQFQMWYKGFIQLAQRSWQFKTISACPVFEWQLVEENPLTGFIFDRKAKTSDKILWYAGYFRLLNGFEKTLYMTVEELRQHGKKYSQTYKKNYWLWETDFDAMAQKTVVKLLLSKFAPLSVEMQTAVLTDQWVIKDDKFEEIEYTDNPPLVESVVEVDLKLLNHWRNTIETCKTIEELNKLKKDNKLTDPTILSMFDNYAKTL